MKLDLLIELDKSFKTYFDNFNRNNGSESLKISLDCIISNYLNLKEDNETSKEELKLIERHLSDLMHNKRSSEYLSWTKDLEALYNEIFPKQKIENNSIKFFESPHRIDADYFLEEQMKKMLQWFDEAIKEMPEDSFYIRETKEKILLECEALVEKLEDKHYKKIGYTQHNIAVRPLTYFYKILLRQKDITLEQFKRINKDADFCDSQISKKIKEILEKAEEDIVKIYDSIKNDFINIP